MMGKDSAKLQFLTERIKKGNIYPMVVFNMYSLHLMHNQSMIVSQCDCSIIADIFTHN